MTKNEALIWATALESGAHIQGRGQLARLAYVNDNPFIAMCCLAVAYHVLRGPIRTTTQTTTIEVCERMGLSDNQRHDFVDMNDMQKLTFPQIAANIRENLEQFEESA